MPARAPGAEGDKKGDATAAAALKHGHYASLRESHDFLLAAITKAGLASQLMCVIT